MSLLIKGMEMPKHALKHGTDDTMYRSCVIVHPHGTAELCIDLEYADMFNFEHRLKFFPLVEIPTPHGRLIDVDELIKVITANDYTLVSEHNSVDRGMFTVGIMQAINEAPTIIEAEGK